MPHSHDIDTILQFVLGLRTGAFTHAEAKRFMERQNPFELVAPGGHPFDPAKFIAAGWKITYDRETLSDTWNPHAALLVSALETWEESVQGSEVVRRLAAQPLLGARAFWHYWNSQDDIPAEWNGKAVHFDATSIESPHGDQCSLCLEQRRGEWTWRYVLFSDRRSAHDYSAALQPAA